MQRVYEVQRHEQVGGQKLKKRVGGIYQPRPLRKVTTEQSEDIHKVRKDLGDHPTPILLCRLDSWSFLNTIEPRNM